MTKTATLMLIALVLAGCNQTLTVEQLFDQARLLRCCCCYTETVIQKMRESAPRVLN